MSINAKDLLDLLKQTATKQQEAAKTEVKKKLHERERRVRVGLHAV
jgi:hypothetical protein